MTRNQFIAETAAKYLAARVSTSGNIIHVQDLTVIDAAIQAAEKLVERLDKNDAKNKGRGIWDLQ